MELKDLMELKALEGNGGMSPYEQFKTQHLQARSHTSGIGVAGLVLGTVGTVAGVTAWLFGGMYGNAKANQAKEAAYAAKEFATTQYNSAILLMNQQNQNTSSTLDRIARMLERETDARVQGDINLTTTINDTVSGSQSGQLSSSQIATNEATAQVMTGLMTGQYSQNPQRVILTSGLQDCGCPNRCGCNG